MNYRQAKKEYRKLYRVIATYNCTRKIKRIRHEIRITSAREEHRSYWECWNRGYPNRTRWRKIFRIV